jgi:hypothetical protein
MKNASKKTDKSRMFEPQHHSKIATIDPNIGSPSEN